MHFCQRLPIALEDQGNDVACVRALGGDALALLLNEVPPPRAALDVLIRFLRDGRIVAAPSIMQRLGSALGARAISPVAPAPLDRPSIAQPARREDQIALRRVVQVESNGAIRGVGCHRHSPLGVSFAPRTFFLQSTCAAVSRPAGAPELPVRPIGRARTSVEHRERGHDPVRHTLQARCCACGARGR